MLKPRCWCALHIWIWTHVSEHEWSRPRFSNGLLSMIPSWAMLNAITLQFAWTVCESVIDKSTNSPLFNESRNSFNDNSRSKPKKFSLNFKAASMAWNEQKHLLGDTLKNKQKKKETVMVYQKVNSSHILFFLSIRLQQTEKDAEWKLGVVQS